MAESVIGNIDQYVYLRREVESMVDDYAFQVGFFVEDIELKTELNVIKHFEPAGVGASSLQECLLLQLDRKEKTENITYAIEILESSFDDFSKKHFEKIIRRLNINEDQFKQIITEIIKLNPMMPKLFIYLRYFMFLQSLFH